MNLAMPDAVTWQDMPHGYDAYLCYVDGARSKDADQVRAAFPGARLVRLTVTGATLDADGIDCEPGNVTAAEAAEWVHRKLAAAPGSRPVVYADLLSKGYSMAECIAAMLALGVTRGQYRVHTAHYTYQAHLCGPACGVGFTADATQWTNAWPGLNGSKVDMSLLAADFFGPPSSWVFGPVRGLVGTFGPHSLRLTWSSPGTPAPEAVHHYQVTVRLKGQDIHRFPVDVPKTGVQESVQWNGVERGTYDEAIVRAVAADGHASPWASVRFAAGA